MPWLKVENELLRSLIIRSETLKLTFAPLIFLFFIKKIQYNAIFIDTYLPRGKLIMSFSIVLLSDVKHWNWLQLFYSLIYSFLIEPFLLPGFPTSRLCASILQKKLMADQFAWIRLQICGCNLYDHNKKFYRNVFFGWQKGNDLSC